MAENNQNKIEFFIKVREKFEEIEDLAKIHNLKDDYISILCVGLFDQEEEDGRCS